MARSTWIALAAIAVVMAIGCASNDIKCPTCPPANSGRIEVFAVIDLDSVHVSVDGGPQATVTFNHRRDFTGLAKGTHTLTATIFRVVDFVPTTTDVKIQVLLDDGETRTVLFHHDFTGVVDRLPLGDPLPLARAGARSRAGWITPPPPLRAA
ncbi:MAG: hypothetical protein HY076_05000 [Candidatus Eisenbacteria bacterium]|uniref:PEGA domain-containing protein n=1 Tax=Eiseniibacteriota bacterium TaxID=2212470 RepID=A0A9D6LBG3_UNCEI|nr:hypothetical protein [Candidatus Eisenbacteria bacterium]MBI3539609.1 hypothetical protein [Candidatus Eisenbacteria bacterium]